MWEAPYSNLVSVTGYPYCCVPRIPHSVWGNSGIVPQIRLRPLLSIYFTINYSLIIRPYIAYTLMTASLNKSQNKQNTYQFEYRTAQYSILRWVYCEIVFGRCCTKIEGTERRQRRSPYASRHAGRGQYYPVESGTCQVQIRNFYNRQMFALFERSTRTN